MTALRQKLDALRTQRTQTAGPNQDTSLAERLKRSRPASCANNTDTWDISIQETLAARLEGQSVSKGLIVIDRETSLDALHGDRPLSGIHHAPLQVLYDNPQVTPERLVFMDTETSGLAGGSGTVVFLLGLARIEDAKLHIRQYLLTAFHGESAMLEHAAQWLDGDETLVTFNGKSFDAPLLATRYRMAGMQDPFAKLLHWDLLHPTRRAFANRWSDCRLATVEERLLGFTRENDLPGAEAPYVWFEWLRFGITRRMPAIVEHNYWDVLSLAGLLPALAETCLRPADRNADVFALARHALRQGRESQAYGLLREHQSELSHNGLLELARLHKRRKQWDAATAIWLELAKHECATSLENLAKYHEHVTGDVPEALHYTQRLLRRKTHTCHRAREQRLLNKLAAHQKLRQGTVDRVQNYQMV